MKTLLPEINSADKRFHAGNPATGEQGTRVTDTWLNDVQDRVRDVQAEAHYVLEKAGFTPKQEQQTQLYQAIVKIIDDNRKSASTTQKGEVRLTSDTGLDSEELGLTAKAGKKLAQMIAVVQLALNNYIPLKSRSSSVTSNDENGVATPKAVKIAYDSANDGINRANNAQLTAEAANRNANTRVAKSGDTMNGDLTVPNINTGAVKSLGYLNISSENGVAFYKNDQKDYLALLSETGFNIRKVVLSPNGYRADNLGYGGYGEQYRSNAPFEVQETGGGGISTFYPFIKGKVMSYGNNGAAFAFGYTTKQLGYYEYGNFGRGVIHLSEDNGRYKNWEFEHTGTLRSAGDVITGNGHSLDECSNTLNNLINGFATTWYGSHYQGAEVHKIKQSKLMIVRMSIGVVNASRDYHLPEAFDGGATAMAIDAGGGANSVGVIFRGGNSVYISVSKPTNVNVIVIGVKY